MKLVKSYTARIDANALKSSNLLFILSKLKEMSQYVFEGGPDYWFDFMAMYHDCRKQFPELNSKILQNFLQLYRPIKGRKLPKSAIKPSIVLDNQNFNLKFNSDTKYTNYWLRFGRKNYPLRGKRILSRIKDLSCVKECRIYKRKKRIYCKLTYVEKVPEISSDSKKSSGVDINTRQLVSSDNKFYSTKKLLHRKIEYKKNRMKSKNLVNYTKDFVHNLTRQIVSDLILDGQEVLVLEDLKGLRQSASKKRGTSKGKELNYRINSLPFQMFRSILEYKCLENGIKLVTINPAYTSMTCSRCGCVANTSRPILSKFQCSDCGFQLHADLNAARNIRSRYTESNESPVNLTSTGG